MPDVKPSGNSGQRPNPPVPAKPGRGRRTLSPEERAQRDAKKRGALMKLASKRVSKAAKAIRLCGNLANYSPTEDQSIKILQHLFSACKEVETRLRSSGKQNEAGFTL